MAVNQKDPATKSESDGDDSNDKIDIDGVDQMDVSSLVEGVDGSTSATTNLGKEVPQGMSTVPLTPSPMGMAKDEYKFQVMDIYINAKGQKICHQKVCDEYFGNDKGSGFFIRDLHSHKV